MFVQAKTVVRAVRAVLVLAAVGIAATPLLIVLDLASGGTGYGICPRGIEDCRNPYSAAPELTMILVAGLIVVLAGVRLTTLIERRYRRSGSEDHT